METFVTFDKIKYVIFDLLVTEAWKQKLFPLLLDDLSKISSIRSYMTIYHEASVLNLLEVMLYHRSACENADDTLVELIDYTYRKFAALLKKIDEAPEGHFKHVKPLDAKEHGKPHDPKAELTRQKEDIEFSITMTCFAIIRFITDHMEHLPASIIH